MRSRPNEPVVQTTYGPVRGLDIAGVSVFKGVRYGNDTGGQNRFLAPRPPNPWSTVVDCIEDPPMARQQAYCDRVYSEVLRGAYDARLEDIDSYVVGSEDCLFLNIWSRSLDASAKAPVILWVHPGALGSWSGVSPWTDGANLSRQENVVVVSFNHRLGPLGFLYLGDRGEARYEEAANPGLLDMIDVLRWLSANIAAFGGDPGNVTIMGESGGAAKVEALIASKPAAGLFHKAIIMGGTPRWPFSRERAAQSTANALDRLGIPARSFRDLHNVPAEDILRAVGDAYPTFVMSGPAVTQHILDPDFPEESAGIPILIGTTADDMAYLTLKEEFPDELDEETARSRLAAVGWGFNEEIAGAALAAAQRLEPGASWRRLFIMAATAAYRDDHLMLVERKLARNGAPVFMYQFDWKCSAFGGRYGAMHVFDVPFAFANIQAAPQIFGSNPDARRHVLEANMSKAWAAFARGESPAHASLPNWPAYGLVRRETMIFNYTCEIAGDPQSSLRLALEELREPRLAVRRAAAA